VIGPPENEQRIEAGMRQRRFGRTGWQVSEVGYGMWGMAGWSGSDDAESRDSLDRAVELGYTFFDTAWAYGQGKSERLLGELIRRHPQAGIRVATKIPPLNLRWPARDSDSLDAAYPPDHVRQYAARSLANLGLDTIDLLQFHVWSDAWAEDPRWREVMEELRRDGQVRAVGISVNRWEPDNGLAAIRTGAVDAVQVIYNIFDQAPEDRLFPLCRELDVAVIARVPFDEGTLTGTLTRESRWPAGDWRNSYFVAANLEASVERAERLRPLIPAGSSMAELALRFILSNPEVSTVIPGMRKRGHVEANAAAGAAGPLSPELLAALREHRWDRSPTSWSQ
jgi:aryl-alcohol dehydrogenase-like predicted oxidoreductase